MKKNIKTAVVCAVILFLIAISVIFLVGRTTSEIVYYGSMEDSFHTMLYLFKDEEVVTKGQAGILRPTEADGKRVYKGARIGAILSAETDEGALHEYLRIQDRIEKLSEFETADGYSEMVRTNEMISEIALQITEAAEQKEMVRLAQLKDTLLIAKDEKSASSGRKEELTELLKSRQNTLRAGIGTSVDEVFSPKAGILLLQTDGLEESMAVKNAENLTPVSLGKLTETVGKTYGGCKILYSNAWIGACTLDENTASKLEEGKSVSLRFHDAEGVMEKATVQSISAAENGQCVITFACNRTPEGLMQNRKTAVDVVLASYSGFRVPNRAIIEENGQKGVYVQTVTNRVFRKVDVAFSDEKYAIIRENENTKLRLYDTVIYK